MTLSAKAQLRMNQVVDRFQSGDISDIVKVALIQLPDDAPGSKWTFTNLALAFCQTGSIDNRGYVQWQTAGRQVVKGQPAAFIFRPQFRKDEKTDEEHLVGFFTIPVFGYDQTAVAEGCEEWALDYTPKELPPLASVAAALNIPLIFEPTSLAGYAGQTDTHGRAIQLGSSDSAIFFHELAHAVHARINGKLKPGQDVHQETVADFAACVLQLLYTGEDRTGNTWKYISHYNKDPLRAILSALRDTEKILAKIEELVQGG